MVRERTDLEAEWGARSARGAAGGGRKGERGAGGGAGGGSEERRRARGGVSRGQVEAEKMVRGRTDFGAACRASGAREAWPVAAVRRGVELGEVCREDRWKPKKWFGGELILARRTGARAIGALDGPLDGAGASGACEVRPVAAVRERRASAARCVARTGGSRKNGAGAN